MNDVLINARKRAGLSQTEVAETLGVSRSTLNRWEQGKTIPYRFHRRKLCALYHLTEHDLGFSSLPIFEEAESPLFDPLIPLPSPQALIGRSQSIDQVKAHLLTPGFTALNGLPGVGKTALAIALAHDPEVRAHFKDGILWAGLGPHPTMHNHLNRWGTLLGLSSSEMSTLSDDEAWAIALRRALGSRRMLLVIDDAWTLEDILTLKVGSPQCAYLVTTRFPALATQVAAERATAIKELNSDEGLLLLRTLAPQIVMREPEQAQKLVQEVGGLPLALTLLGNYLRTQGYHGQHRRVHQALQRLHDREARLAIHTTEAPGERHPSLRNTPLSLQTVIEVTVQHLDPAVQAALFALSVFPAKPETFSEEAALAIADCSEEVLDALVDAGVLEISDTHRYTLHQTITDYARLSWPPGIQERFIQYMLHYLENHQNDDQALRAEVEMMFAALDICRHTENHRAFLGIMKLVARYLIQLGFVARLEPYVRFAYHVAEAEDVSSVAVSLEHFAWVLISLGHYAQAREHLLQGLALVRQNNALEERCLLLKRLGNLEFVEGNYHQSEIYLQEGLSIGRRLNVPRLMLPLLINLANTVSTLGNSHFGCELLMEALDLSRTSGIDDWLIHILSNLVIVFTITGQIERSEQYLEEALELSQQSGFLEGRANLLSSDAWRKNRQGKYRQAFDRLKEGLRLYQMIADPDALCHVFLLLGSNAERRGHYQEAESYFQDSLTILEQTPGMKKYWSRFYAEHAALLCKQGKYRQAMDECQNGLTLDPATQENASFHRCALQARMAFLTCVQSQTGAELSPLLADTWRLAGTLLDPEDQNQVRCVLGEIECLLNSPGTDRHLEEALAQAKQYGFASLEVQLLHLLGERALARHDIQQAERWLTQGRLLAQQHECPENSARLASAWGALLLEKQQGTFARLSFQEALQHAPKDNPWLRSQALFGFARVARDQGQVNEARRFGAASLQELEAIGDTHAEQIRQWLASLDLLQVLPSALHHETDSLAAIVLHRRMQKEPYLC